MAFKFKADLTVKNGKGQTALDAALVANHEDTLIVDALLRNGATAKDTNLRKVDKKKLASLKLESTANVKLEPVQPSPRGQEALDALASTTDSIKSNNQLEPLDPAKA